MKIGDVVRANNGGPKMTINRMFGNTAICIWFDDVGVLHEQQFAVSKLRIDNTETV